MLPTLMHQVSAGPHPLLPQQGAAYIYASGCCPCKPVDIYQIHCASAAHSCRLFVLSARRFRPAAGRSAVDPAGHHCLLQGRHGRAPCTKPTRGRHNALRTRGADVQCHSTGECAIHLDGYVPARGSLMHVNARALLNIHVVSYPMAIHSQCAIHTPLLGDERMSRHGV